MASQQILSEQERLRKAAESRGIESNLKSLVRLEDGSLLTQSQAKNYAKPDTQSQQTSTTIPTSTATRTVNVNLTLGGRSATIPTSESGADALLKILEQAQSALGS